MLRDLQSFIVNADASKKAKVAIKRGTFVNKLEATGEFDLPTVADEVYVVDRDYKVTKALAQGEVVSDYDDDQELILKGEFASLIKLQAGVRKATSEYSGADVDLAVGKYLTISVTTDATQGKLIPSPANAKTNIKSLGYIIDAGSHKLLGFEVVK